MATGWDEVLSPKLGPTLHEIARLAEDEARQRGQAYIDGRHLAYGLTRHPAGHAAVVRAGIDPLRRHLGNGGVLWMGGPVGS